MLHPDADILEVDVVTGRKTALARVVTKALKALEKAKIPHAVIGATALGVRGLPRMTRDLDVVVLTEDAYAALDALVGAGFRSAAPIRRSEEPEPMYVLESKGGIDVDLLVAAGEPESTVVAEASEASVFGTSAPVATLEHLLLMYFYSNEPRHLGDFARVVTESEVNLEEVTGYLSEVHPEMLPVFQERVRQALHPPPPPPRPRKRRRS
ncbi:MAG TPA: hypothetical protein VLK65_24610 [Vicinamibacteria bacterium]|nr:hypothetical protein [Vicinamibacteria bacterium]